MNSILFNVLYIKFYIYIMFDLLEYNWFEDKVFEGRLIYI